MDSLSETIARRIGHRFTDEALLREALTHPSLSGSAPGNYQRLEFLGDAVTGLLVAELLYARFPDSTEGELSRRLAALVRASTMAQLGASLGLGELASMSASEAAAGGRETQSNLEDLLEALLGALYLDGGLEAARKLAHTLWTPLLDSVQEASRDAKTALQEAAQGRGLPLPRYEEADRSGPAHAPHFVVTVHVEGWPPQTGEGASKRTAQQQAAAKMLAAMQENAS